MPLTEINTLRPHLPQFRKNYFPTNLMMKKFENYVFEILSLIAELVFFHLRRKLSHFCLKVLSLKCQIIARTKRLRAHSWKSNVLPPLDVGDRCIFTRDIKCRRVRKITRFLQNYPKGRMAAPNRMNFRKSNFQSKNLCCRFWEL